MSTHSNFRIATTLLHDSNTAWANLGLWQKGCQNYLDAAVALANRHWALAQPAAHARVLDAGCGYGASLHHWRSLDSTVKLTALECQQACLHRLNEHGWSALNGRFDTLPLPEGLAVASQDTVICLDAAYHARSLLDFARFAAQALRPGGVLVFSTLVVPPRVTSRTSWLLRVAGVPLASQVSAEALLNTLGQAGFDEVKWADLDAEGQGVLAGFAQYVKRRASALTLRQRMSAEWFKIAMTGKLCAHLSTETEVRYVVVRAVLQRPN